MCKLLKKYWLSICFGVMAVGLFMTSTWIKDVVVLPSVFYKGATLLIYLPLVSTILIKLILDILINKGKEKTCYFALKDITLQAIMTSLDSLFLGIPLSFNSNTYLNLIVITGISTFIVCLLGLLIAKKITSISEDKINLLGAIILFIFAFKSLI